MILVASDGSADAEAAMRIALDIAAHSADDVAVVGVWQELHATLGIPVGVEQERRWARVAADSVAELAREVGLQPEIAIRHGRPGKEICRFAADRDARMVVLGSRGSGTLASALLGSVSLYVSSHAPCPVLVVPASSRIAAGPDASDASLETKEPA